MQVRTREGGEYRSSDIFWEVTPPPGYMSAFGGEAGYGFGYGILRGGEIWRIEDAFTIAAVDAAVQLIATTIASMPLVIYRTLPDGTREVAHDTWQHRLLHDVGPNPYLTPFDFLSDLASCAEASGNAYAQKVRLPDGTLELHIVDPTCIQIKQALDGEKAYIVRLQDGTTHTLASNQILHVRGFTIIGGARGQSPIGAHRRLFSNLSSLEEYQREFFLNSAAPGGVIEVPSPLEVQKGAEMMRAWAAAHQGPSRYHQPAILHSGATWKSIAPSLADAEWVNTAQYLVQEVARVFGIPPVLLGVPQTRPISTEEEMARWFKVGLGPRLKRLESALACDPDLFPPGQGLRPCFEPDELLRALTLTRFQSYSLARQGGWMTLNEIRVGENLPPLPGGDELQQTPVGGAPNPAPPDASGGDGLGD